MRVECQHRAHARFLSISFSLTHTHTHALSLSLSLSLALSHTHTTHTHKYTHTHTQAVFGDSAYLAIVLAIATAEVVIADLSRHFKTE